MSLEPLNVSKNTGVSFYCSVYRTQAQRKTTLCRHVRYSARAVWVIMSLNSNHPRSLRVLKERILCKYVIRMKF